MQLYETQIKCDGVVFFFIHILGNPLMLKILYWSFFCAFDQANVNAVTPGTESQLNIYILWYNTAACALFGSLRAVTHQQQKAFLQDKKCNIRLF